MCAANQPYPHQHEDHRRPRGLGNCRGRVPGTRRIGKSVPKTRLLIGEPANIGISLPHQKVAAIDIALEFEITGQRWHHAEHHIVDAVHEVPLKPGAKRGN